jgi:hypothetical protein
MLSNELWGQYSLPNTFVLSKDEVKHLLTLDKGKYWVVYKNYEKPDFLEKWNKIGFGFYDDTESEQIIRRNYELNAQKTEKR